MLFLHSHGVGTSRSVKNYKTYGDKAIELIRENPYRLANDIPGIGFKIADQIARKMALLRIQSCARLRLLKPLFYRGSFRLTLCSARIRIDT
jgi:ATP-dependent exoDNAse (exonuclease V) alpha subunit